MADISLSKAVRSNLLSLQNTASMMSKTQERLSTGNKVNSALDNPTNFFTAAGLNSRAGDMNQLMDSMANGIQTLEAADNGLTSITKTLESMQSTLRQARQDKSFQTTSFEISPSATGNLNFSGGAVGATGKSIALENTALTEIALGLDNAVSGTPGTADTDAVASTLTGAGGVTITTAGTLAITVGSAPAFNVALAVGETLEDVMANINTEAGSEVASMDGGQIKLTNAAGTGVSVAAGAGASEVFGTGSPVAGSAFVAGDKGTAALTWGGSAIEVNKDAKIAFTAKVDGKDQKIEITREDVMKAGNGDGTINDAAEFASILGAKLGVTASATGNAITLTSTTTGTTSNIDLGAATVSGTAYNADELVQKINSDSGLTGKIRASNDDGKLRIENQSTQDLVMNGVNSAGLITGTNNDAKIGGNTIRDDLSKQFNELRDQLDKLADDASFNGINLLRGDKLTITFNETGTSSIDIQTKGQEQINAANFDVFDIAGKDLDSDTNIDSLLQDLKSALNDVRSQSSAFGSNLSIVQNRQDFTKNMVNTLQTGAANLTLADMNEEAANLLALQTRQSLSSNSLSLASQADQSVLQLIR